MAISEHLKELTNKHAHLERTIRDEQKTPVPDTLRLTALKKQKLQLKEQIAHFQAQ